MAALKSLDFAKYTLTLTGSNGSATFSGQVSGYAPELTGFLYTIFIDFKSQPSTTDLAIAEVSGAQRTFVNTTDVNTDGYYYGGSDVLDGSGSDASLDVYAPLVGAQLTFTAAGGNAGDIDVYVYLLP